MTDGLQSRSVKAAIWSLLQSSFARLFSVIIYLVLARFFLREEDFGLAALALVFTEFLNVIVRQGLGAAIIQRPKLHPDHMNGAFYINIASGLVAALGTLVLADSIAVLLGDDRLALLLRALAIVPIVTGFVLVHEAMIRRFLGFKTLMVRTLIANLCGGVAAIVVAFAGGGVWALIAFQVVAAVVGAVALWTASDWRPKWSFDRRRVSELFPMSGGVFVLALLGFFGMFLDQIILGVVVGVVGLGLYDVANRLVRVLSNIFVQGLEGVLFAGLSRMNGDTDRISGAISRLFRLSTAISFPIFLGLSVTADLIVLLLFGPDWTDAAPVMALLCIAACFKSIDGFGPSIFNAVARPGMAIRLHLLSVILLLGLGLGVGSLGPTAMAGVMCIRGYIMTIAWLVMIRLSLRTPITPMILAVGQNSVAGLLMVAGVLIGRHSWEGVHLVLDLAFSILVGVLVYSTAILIFSRRVLEELMTLRQAVRKARPA